MSFFLDIHTALDTRLSTLAGGVAIAWENIEYTPVKGTPYLRPTVIMSPSSLLGLGLDDLQMNEGIYQIDLFYPVDKGAGDLLAKADAIYTHFKGDRTLVSNSVTTHIKEISRTVPIIIDEAWQRASVEIHFKCYNN